MAHSTRFIENDRLAGALVVAIAVVSLAFANFLITTDGDNGGAGPFLVTSAVVLVLAAAVFGWLVPRLREGSPAKAALALALAGVITLPVFWSGVPQVLAPAAIALGIAARGRDSGTGIATAAIAAGSLAYLASLVGAVAG